MFTSQNLCLLYVAHFRNSVFEESVKGYLVTPGGLWWARKRLPMKPAEKRYEQQLSDVCIRLLDLNHPFDWAAWNHCFCGIWGRTYGNDPQNMEKEISSGKIQKEAFCETALCWINSSHSDKLLFSLSSFLALCMFSVWWDIREHFETNSEKGNMFRPKLERSFLRNCFVTCAFN